MSSIKRFIIIDDDESNHHLCSYIIQKVAKDLDVIQFINPLKALEYLEQGQYQQQEQPALTVMLLDIKMPEISGWEFLDRYEHMSIVNKHFIRIYILTSSESAGDKQMADGNKLIKSYVQKPLTAGAVQNILAGLI